jgi:hypothetical protein
MTNDSDRKVPVCPFCGMVVRFNPETEELGEKCKYAEPYEFGGTLCILSALDNYFDGRTHYGFCGEVICPFCDGKEYREGIR